MVDFAAGAAAWAWTVDAGRRTVKGDSGRATGPFAGCRSGAAGGVHEPHRAGVGLDAALADQPLHQLVLAVGEPAHGLRVGRVVRVAIGEVDAAAGQERAYAVVARLAVDVLVVVAHGVERRLV